MLSRYLLISHLTTIDFHGVHMVAKLNMVTDARSVCVKVWPHRPFSGGSIGDPVQLSPTSIGDSVQLFRDPAQLHPAFRSLLHLLSEQLHQ